VQGLGADVAAIPVVGYAVTYPLGVVIPILAIFAFQKALGTDYRREAESLRELGAGGEDLHNVTLRLTRPDVAAKPIEAWLHEGDWHVLPGRWRSEGRVGLTTPETVLAPGDELALIGDHAHLGRALAALGERTAEHLEHDRSRLDFRRVFVSNHDVAGRTVGELELRARFGALLTRVRRGDVDVLPDPAMRLQLGDRVRVVAPRERMAEVARFFGDSYRALSEVDMASLGLGIALGLLLGQIPIPLPGGVTFKLGMAGGPLIVALALGTLGRTGPVIWQLPYNANLTLRELGLILFLAGVGTRSGYAFASTVGSTEGLAIVLAGAAVTLTTAVATLWIGYVILRIPLSLLAGMVAGIHTQPAVLGFATEQTGNDLPTIGYATVFPLATLVKILLAQLVLAWLPGTGSPF
jgi:putative transport protein